MPVLSNPAESRRDEIVEPTPTESGSTRRTRRRWPWTVATVGLAGAVAGIVVLAGADEVEPNEPEPVTLAAVSAEVRDLIEFDELDGRMIYADVEPIGNGRDGVITSLLDSGDTVERGTILYLSLIHI